MVACDFIIDLDFQKKCIISDYFIEPDLHPS